MIKSAKVLVGLLILVVLAYALDHKIGQTPALGRIFSPFQGVWREPLTRKLKAETLAIASLAQPLTVVWDEFRVPHFRAQNLHDLYLAQGYVHASQRLFQMEIQARAGGGRLAELVGPKATSIDRFLIRFGLREAVRRATQMMLSDSATSQAVTAYVAGVNAYIDTLTEQTLPVEYRVLGVWPEHWRPEQVGELLKIMSFRLAGRSYDLPLTNYLQKFGRDKVSSLFPEAMAADRERPFIKSFDLSGLKLPVKPDGADAFVTAIQDFPDTLKPFATNGSNSWAVGPERSLTGASILANDTHLGLSVPGVFFEQQLQAPGINVYGVTFPGCPGVVIGFNERVAWGITNGTTDVVDWSEVEFQSSDSSTYTLDNAVRTAEIQTEVLRVKGEPEQKIDVIWTELGVVMHREGRLGLAVAWTAHQPSNELKSFLNADISVSAENCRTSFSNFVSPISNITCVDANNISITHAGRIPLRWPGQGRHVMDGRTSRAKWVGYLDAEHFPKEVNPAEGYVFSANQRPLPYTSPLDLSWDYENSYRGMRIVEELTRREKAGPEDFMLMQKDALDPLARSVLPVMLDLLPTGDSDVEKIRAQLRKWNFEDSLSSVEATIFSHWWDELKIELYEDQLGPSKQNLWPRDQRTDLLLHQVHESKSSADSFWIDNQNTIEHQEDLPEVLQVSLKRAIAGLQKEFGAIGPAWAWGLARVVRFGHIGRFPGFDVLKSSPGSRHAINAVRENHGPALRMIVAMGSPLRAWTRVPGGTNGHVFSQDESDEIDDWAAGSYKQVHFWGETESIDQSTNARIWSLAPVED